MGCTKPNVVDFNEINIFDETLLIRQHNYYRSRHNCPDLKISKELSEMATEYAKQLLDSKTPIFSSHTYKGQVLGENIFNSEQKINIEKVCNKWYEEHKNYKYNINKFQKGTNHFTQLIWKKSELIGFGLSSNENKFYLVVYYFPAGNVFGEFDNNVPTP